MVTLFTEKLTRAEKHRVETAKVLAQKILKEQPHPIFYAKVELERQGVNAETRRMVQAMVEGGVV